MQWVRSCRILGDCMTCMGMFGSGCRTGGIQTIIIVHLGLTPRGLHPAPFASSGAATSTMLPSICGRRFALGIRRAIAATSLVRAFSGFITLDPFYPLALGRVRGCRVSFGGKAFRAQPPIKGRSVAALRGLCPKRRGGDDFSFRAACGPNEIFLKIGESVASHFHAQIPKHSRNL